MKLKINLFIKEDNFNKAYPVTIFDGNIIPDKSFPSEFSDERANFKYQCAPTYKDISKNKVNTRFIYPYSRRYGKHLEGAFEAYAFLNPYERIKLSLIAKTSVIHRHPFQFVFIIINILAFIPLWIPFLFSDNPQNNQSQMQNLPQEVKYKQAEIDSLQSQQADTLKKDTLLKK